MKFNIKMANLCREGGEFCRNCYIRFMMVRPLIKDVVVTKHFTRDLKEE